MDKNLTSAYETRVKQDLVASVYEDFERRREERKNIESQWRLNLNYLAGNQYCEISQLGDVIETEKYYGWQSRSVFNHIAPVIDTRLAKLMRVRPTMSVRASSGEDSDLITAEISSEILNATYNRVGLDKVISKTTTWSEVCGTGFYKILWSTKKGKTLGENEGTKIKEGDVDIISVSPFEIFPESIFKSEISDLNSIIHARAVDVNDIYETYNVMLKGEDVDVFTLSKSGVTTNGGYKAKSVSSTLKNHVILIEKYSKPTKEYPNGRLVIVAGNTLLFEGDLPYLNGVDGKRDLPFVKQIALTQAGCFFGVSIIERLIPIQRAYNAVKNRKYEFMNRVSMGVLNVEDGSIDTEELIDEGLSPGKVIVYRQGSRPPQIMNSESVPLDFTYEEERLTNEIISISGISEMSRTSQILSAQMSGTAIELLIEQDDTRLSATAESIRTAVKEIAKQILRLFKQFASTTRIMRSAGTGKSVKVFYFSSSDISSDDVVFDTENEVALSPAQKKNAVLEMLNTGLLSDENGKISSRTKSKILQVLGYGSLENTQDITALHRAKAEKENVTMLTGDVSVSEYDDHQSHLYEHVKKILEEDVKDDKNEKYLQRLIAHYSVHKSMITLG